MEVAKNHELDWLPPGWKVEDKVENGRKVRCFINVKSSQRLYSKDSVLRQVRKSKANNQGSHFQLSNGPITRSSRNKEIPIPTEPNDCNDLLPHGWITEVKTRKSGIRAGEDYKTYIESSTGKIFYSKPEVTRYLKGKAQSNDSFERKKSGTTVDSSIKGSVCRLRRHKTDQGEEVVPHPKFDEGKSVKVALRQKSAKGKSEEVPQNPEFDEGKAKELPLDPNIDEGKRELLPQDPKLDERKKEEVPGCRKLDEGKAKDVNQVPKSDKGKQEVPQDPNFYEGKKSQPSRKRKGPVRLLRSHKPDQGEDLAPHPKFDEGKNEGVPQHPKSAVGDSKELPQDSNFDKGKRKMVPLHPKLDESKKKVVTQHQKFDEGKAEEVTQHPRFNERKREERPQDPKFDEEKKRQSSKRRKAIVETEIDEGLPPGWIKEIRIKESSNGVRKDPFYFNSTSGYVFRSRLDALRYLETGEISKHAYKRRVSGRNIIHSTQESPSDLTVRSKTTEDSTKMQLFTGAGEKNPKQSSFLNSGYSKAGNSALLDSADVDIIPTEVQKLKGNVSVVRSDAEPISSLKDTFLEKKHEDSIKANALPVKTKPATSPSKNEFAGVELSKDKEGTGKWSTESREREKKRNSNEMGSSRRSSKRLAGIEIDHVTHSVAIERALRSANRKSEKIEAGKSWKASEEETICHYNTESATDVFREEQSKDKEETGKNSSERKPKRNRKKVFEGIEVDPVTSQLSSGRVLRSAVKVSTTAEPIPTVGSDQGEHAQEAPQATDVGSQEEIDLHGTEPATLPSNNELLVVERTKNLEEMVCHYTEPATVPPKNEKTSSEKKPKRNRKQIVSPHRSSNLLAGTEDEPVSLSRVKHRFLQSARTEAMLSSGSEQGQQTQDAPLVINSRASNFAEEQTAKASSRSSNTHQTMMIDFSRNTIGSQTTVEPERNNFTDQMFKEPPKINSKERSSTDELTNGREKEQQDSPFSFPWSDPCIEFAYKTLTGALPLDDTVAIHDYVQHQIRTVSNSSNNNFTFQDSRPPGFSLNTIPSNSSNSITFPDPGPPGFSRGSVPSNRNDNFALPEARPPGFQENSNSGGNPTFQDAMPPGFSFNAAPSSRGNNLALPHTTPPGFSLNDIPSDCAMPPGFSLNDFSSNCGNNIAFSDVTPPGFSLNGVSASRGNNLATPPGFSLNDIPSNRGNIITFPDSGPPGFSQSSAPSNSSNNLGISDGTPPGFTRNSVPSNRSDNFTLPEARPTGFSQSSVLSNRSDNFAIPDTKPPGFFRNSVPSDSNDHFVLPDTRSPGFTLNNAPPNKTDHFALLDARQRGFLLNNAPSNSNADHFALPDAKQPGLSWKSAPSNSNSNNFAPPDARRTGLSRGSNRAPSNSYNNPVYPDANPPSWSGFPLDCGINLNVAFTDDGPPGFTGKNDSSPKQQLQDANQAAPHTEAADFPLQGTMFSSWNRDLR